MPKNSFSCKNLNIYLYITNNIFVNRGIIISLFVVFIVLIFPIYVFNYVYINSEEGYASVNVTLFRFIKICNINTVKNDPSKMQFNGREKSIAFKGLNKSYLKIFKLIRIQKVIQLCDIGVLSEINNYIALCQHVLTGGLKTFCLANGKHVKIKNYIILNQEHEFIRYYAKAVTVLNLLTVVQILFIIIMEKLNDYKT